MICNLNLVIFIGSGYHRHVLVSINVKLLFREAPKSTHVEIDSENYKFEFGSYVWAYISYYNDMKRNTPALEKQLKNKHTKVRQKYIPKNKKPN